MAGWTSDELAALDSAGTLTTAAGDPENPANNQTARDRVEVGMAIVPADSTSGPTAGGAFLKGVGPGHVGVA